MSALDYYGASTVKRLRRTGDEIDALDDAIVDAVAEESPVSLRGVFYRCVSAGAIDKTELGYRAVGRRLLELRRAGRVSYASITDGTRWIYKPRTFDSWQEALEESARSYRQALWSTSDYRLQLFTEKDAITGAIDGVTERYDIALGVLRGYSGESFAWRVAQSLHPDRINVLGQLGDHDPSGVGAWADFTGKVAAFAGATIDVEFARLAVTEQQIIGMGLPLRPTKQSDVRARGWVGGSVEVDAIRPSVLRNIVEDWITFYIDEHALEVAKAVEDSERDALQRLAGWGAS